MTSRIGIAYRMRWGHAAIVAGLFAALFAIAAGSASSPADAVGAARSPAALAPADPSAVTQQAVSLLNLQTAFPKATHAAALWNKPGGGFTGKGVGVAVIDTGVAGDLADFQGADGESRVVQSAVTNPDATTATDLYG